MTAEEIAIRGMSSELLADFLREVAFSESQHQEAARAILRCLEGRWQTVADSLDEDDEERV